MKKKGTTKGLMVVGSLRKDGELADNRKGWALVMVNGERCSPQTIVTHCTLYQQYMTDAAMQESIKSYGGLTREVIR